MKNALAESNVAELVRIEPTPPVESAPPAPQARRFLVPDLSTHGSWLIPRMLKTYPELTEHTAVGWLKQFMVNNEFFFVRTDHAAALVQIMPGYSLIPVKIVQERFVWCADPKNLEYVDEAASLYGDIYHWARRLNGIRDIIVDESSDAPRARIAQCLVDEHKCRLLTREMSYVRIKER